MYMDKDRQREYQRRWMQKRRDEWIKANGPCQLCGSSKDLEVDHIDRKTKLYTPTKLWGMSRTNPKRVAELAKCQVLCTICHNTKTVAEKSIPCNDRLAERKGCNCDLCKKLHASRMRRWRKGKASEVTGMTT